MINFLGRPNDALFGAYKGQAQGFPQYLSRSVGFATHVKDVNLLFMEVVIKAFIFLVEAVLMTTSMDNNQPLKTPIFAFIKDVNVAHISGNKEESKELSILCVGSTFLSSQPTSYTCILYQVCVTRGDRHCCKPCRNELRVTSTICDFIVKA